MARIATPTAEDIYRLAARLKQNCLLQDGSLIFPGETVWTSENVRAFLNAFTDSGYKDEESFIERYRAQFAKEPKGVARFAAEILAVFYLFPADIKKKKVEDLRRVLSLSKDTIGDDHDLARTLSAGGIGRGGQGYFQRRPDELTYLAKAVAEIKALDKAARQRVLATGTEFQRILDNATEEGRRRQIRQILLHILYPDQYERIASRSQKKRILEAFGPEVFGKDEDPWPEDIDEALRRIRGHFEKANPQERIDFYSTTRIHNTWADDEAEPGEEGGDSAAPTCWLFQANPKVSRILHALYDLPELTFAARQSKNQMKAGDPALIWMSGTENGGIYAVGTITEAAEDRVEDPDELAYRIEKAESASEPRVRIRIDRNLILRPILRRDLIEDPVLKDLPVLQFANATVYEISADHWKAIEERIEPTPREWSREELLLGLELFLRGRDGAANDKRRNTERLARVFGRTEAAITGRLQDLRHLATGEGRAQAAGLARYIWAEYKSDTARALKDATTTRERLLAGGGIRRQAYWKVSPGKEGALWEEMRESGVIGIDYSQMGDLSGLRSQAEALAAYRKAYPGNSTKSDEIQTRLLWYFIGEIREGDVVVANRGRSVVLGRGVVGKYRYEPGRAEYPHLREVQWFDTAERQVEEQGAWAVAVERISPELYRKLFPEDGAESANMEFVPNEVQTIAEIREGLRIFNEQLVAHRSRATTITQQTTYWVFDDQTRRFAPSKFCGYRGMTFERYEGLTEAVKKEKRPGFDGTEAREAIEKVTGRKYEADKDLGGRLVEWARECFGPETLEGVARSKWRFVYLPRAKEDALAAKPAAVAAKPDVYSFVRDARFRFPDELITTYLLSLMTKPFVILSGISGTGKTKLAQLVAEWAESSAPEPPRVSRRPPSAPDANTWVYQLQRFNFSRSLLYIYREWEGRFGLEAGAGARDSIIHYRGKSYATRILELEPAGRQYFRARLPAEFMRSLTEDLEIGDFVTITPRIDGDTTQIDIAAIEAEEEIEQAVVRRHEFISVRPDWLDGKGILGYLNPITNQYVTPAFLRLLLEAHREKDKPYFAILDEMNLARVEHYFSDLLSATESRRLDGDKVLAEPVQLHDRKRCIPLLREEQTDWEPPQRCTNCTGGRQEVQACPLYFDGVQLVPPQIEVPPNLHVTGTVNIDETTHAFSPKVLDRANVIEFNRVDLSPETSQADGGVSSFRFASNVELRGARPAVSGDYLHLDGRTRKRVEDLNARLERYNLHFGYRVANEMGAYIHAARGYIGEDAVDTALDLQFVQKVLPKLNGPKQKLQRPLEDLLAFALAGGSADETDDAREKLLERVALGTDPWADAVFPRTARKVSRMLRTLRQQGFVSAIE